MQQQVPLGPTGYVPLYSKYNYACSYIRTFSRKHNDIKIQTIENTVGGLLYTNET